MISCCMYNKLYREGFRLRGCIQIKFGYSPESCSVDARYEECEPHEELQQLDILGGYFRICIAKSEWKQICYLIL